MRSIRFVSAILLVALATPVHSEPIYQVTNPPPNTSDGWPTFSPRGDKVAFVRWPDSSDPVSAVLVADLATSAEDTLVSGLPPGFNPNGGVEWSPDGRKIAFYAHSQSGGHSAVWIADLPGSGIPRIVASGVTPNGAEFISIDTEGNTFVFGQPGCGGPGLGAVSIAGNMFGGAAPSPVVNAMFAGNNIIVTLENGDVWLECWPAFPGTYAGNVFSMAGVSAVGASASRPQSRIATARPNPFNPSVRIPYTVATAGRISLRIFDVSGRQVRTLEDVPRVPGQYTAHWDGSSDEGIPVASGTYFLRAQFGDGSKSEQKVTLVR